MNRFLSLALVPMLAAGLAGRPAAAQPDLDHIQVKYHGGPLLRRVRVATLFWGPDWEKSLLPSYFNGFFKALFADKRFMANLAQYSAGDYTIENGVFGDTGIDTVRPDAQLNDAQIPTEIRGQIAAGNLPPPDENTVYFVFTPTNVVVTDPAGADSRTDIAGYHNYAAGDTAFPYAVIPYDKHFADPHFMTITLSHELAEAVTDPQPSEAKTAAWYDENNGEIGDIPIALYEAGRIEQGDLIDLLPGARGALYRVQKQWSIKDAAPVAFAAGGG